MTPSPTYRIALMAVAGFLLPAVFHAGAVAQANSPQGVRNIVIAHGAWADASSWSKVIPLLQAKGLRVVAVQNPLTSLADDVAATKRAIALQDGPVLLVGHSYGGVVITEAGNDPRVVGLVYVGALVPSDGESVASITKPFPPAPILSEARADAEGFLTVRDDDLCISQRSGKRDATCGSRPRRTREAQRTARRELAGMVRSLYCAGAGRDRAANLNDYHQFVTTNNTVAGYKDRQI